MNNPFCDISEKSCYVTYFKILNVTVVFVIQNQYFIHHILVNKKTWLWCELKNRKYKKNVEIECLCHVKYNISHKKLRFLLCIISLKVILCQMFIITITKDGAIINITLIQRDLNLLIILIKLV